MAVLIIFTTPGYDLVKSRNFELFFSYVLYRTRASFKQLLLLAHVSCLPEQLHAVNIGSILCINNLYDF